MNNELCGVVTFLETLLDFNAAMSVPRFVFIPDSVEHTE